MTNTIQKQTKQAKSVFEDLGKVLFIILAIIGLNQSFSYQEPATGQVADIQKFSYSQNNLNLPELKKDISNSKLPQPKKQEVKVGIQNPKVTLLNTSTDYTSIYNFVLNTYPGSRIDKAYLDLLASECKDVHTLKLVISASVSESGMGKHLPHRKSNFWGWFLGGDRNYDPDRPTMAKQICGGFRNRYRNIYNGNKFDYSLVKLYTGNDRPTTWSKNFAWAYNKMS